MLLVDAFCAEHGLIYAELNHLEKTYQSLDLPSLQAAMALLEAGLLSHAELEDELLFAHLEKQMGPGPGPLTVMRREHELVDGAVAAARLATSLREALSAIPQAIEICRSHFAKEELVLFPMARQLLGDAMLTELCAELLRRRGVKVT